MSQENKDKADAAEARTHETRGFMHQKQWFKVFYPVALLLIPFNYGSPGHLLA